MQEQKYRAHMRAMPRPPKKARVELMEIAPSSLIAEGRVTCAADCAELLFVPVLEPALATCTHHSISYSETIDQDETVQGQAESDCDMVH